MVINDSVVSVCMCVHYGEDTVHMDGHKKFIIFLRMYRDLYTNSYNAFVSAREDPYVKSGALSVDELPNNDFKGKLDSEAAYMGLESKYQAECV